VIRPIRQAQSSTEAHSKSGPEALEGQAHHPEQSRRTDGVSKGEKRQLSPFGRTREFKPRVRYNLILSRLELSGLGEILPLSRPLLIEKDPKVLPPQ